MSTSSGSQSVGNFLDSINITSSFTLTHSITDASCSGTTANSDGTARVFPAGCPPFTYSWNTVPVQTTQTAAGLAPGTYVCTVTDGNSCSLNDTVTISAASAAPLTVNSSTVCNGDTANLTASGSGPGGIYSWSPSTALSATTGASVRSFPSATIVYTVNGLSTGGCLSTGQSTVTVNQPATLSISSTNSSGSNGTATVLASGIGPYTYSWLPSGGTGPVATGLAPGVYTVTVTDGNGCRSMASVTVVNSSGCNWHTQLADSYEYQTPCPDLVPNTTFQTVPQTFKVYSGTYSLYMNFRDSTLTNGTHAGDLVYNRRIPACPGIPVRISSYLTTSFAGVQCDIRIQVIDKTGNVLADTPSIAIPYHPLWYTYLSPVMTPASDTILFRLYTNIGGGLGNDLSMDDFLVEQCYADIPSVHIPYGTICESATPFSFYPLLTDTPVTGGTWTGPSALGSGYLGNFNPAVNTSGNYIYQSAPFGTAAACPLGKDTVTIAVLQAPLAANSVTPVSGPPPLLVTFNDLSAGATSTLWNFGDGSFSAAPDTVHTYTASGTYNGFFVVANAQCADTAYFTINVMDSLMLFIPNVFTPDGDNLNDSWQFKEHGYSSIDVRIFNRWGEKIFEWNQLNGSWNGETKGGNLAADGIYYYIVKAQPANAGSAPLDYHGTVTLINGKK